MLKKKRFPWNNTSYFQIKSYDSPGATLCIPTGDHPIITYTSHLLTEQGAGSKPGRKKRTKTCFGPESRRLFLKHLGLNTHDKTRI